MQFYLCNCDFRKRKNKQGEEYGWDVAIYSSIEHIHGYDYVTGCYREKPEDSRQKIADNLKELFPEVTEKQIKKLIK